MSGGATLRAYCYIDRMQPQYAAFCGTVTSGDLPLQGDTSLYLEFAPSNLVFSAIDVAVKSSGARPGAQLVEREFGLIEVHSGSQSDVQQASSAMLDALRLDVHARVRPSLHSVEIISNVGAYQSQLVNRFSKGSMIVPGDSMLVLECSPATYINLAANEAEKAADIKLIHLTGVGMFGRMWIAGAESAVIAARDFAVAALERA